jgi:hypothetical protein
VMRGVGPRCINKSVALNLTEQRKAEVQLECSRPKGGPTTHSTGLAMSEPFVNYVDSSPVNSGVRWQPAQITNHCVLIILKP